MKNNQARLIKDLRWVGIAEGLSFLVLLLIAMPMKYMLGFPLPVKYTGWVHGLLFMAYVFLVIRTTLVLGWGYKRAALFMAASVIPLATFILDGNLKKEQQRFEAGTP